MGSPNIDQIFDEIRQIRTQYESEVGRARKAWPKSIRERVVRLSRLGLRYKKIAERSGISANTIYTWMPRQEKHSKGELTLISLPVSVPEPQGRHTKKLRHEKTPTVTVKIGDQIKITGLRASEVLRLLRGLGV